MDRVLIAVDGEEQAGRATAYLIDRVHETSELEIVVLTVQSAEPPPLPETAPDPYPLRLSAAKRRRKSPSAVEGARPWLEGAGVRYEFLRETGDLSEVVNRMVREQVFNEVVLVSQEPLANRFLAPWTGSYRRSTLAKLKPPRCTRLFLVRSGRPPSHRP